MLASRSFACCLSLALAGAALSDAHGGERWRIPAWLKRPVVRSQSPEILTTSHSVYSDDEPQVVPARPVFDSCCPEEDCCWWDCVKERCRSIRRNLYFKHRDHDDCHRLYPTCAPFCTPNHGYYPTCWRRIPEFNHCPPPIDPFACSPEFMEAAVPAPYLAPPPEPALPDEAENDFGTEVMPPAPPAPPVPEIDEPDVYHRDDFGNELGAATEAGPQFVTRQQLIAGEQYPATHVSMSAPRPPWENVVLDESGDELEAEFQSESEFEIDGRYEGEHETVGFDEADSADETVHAVPTSSIEPSEAPWRATYSLKRRTGTAHRDDLPLE